MSRKRSLSFHDCLEDEQYLFGNGKRIHAARESTTLSPFHANVARETDPLDDDANVVWQQVFDEQSQERWSESIDDYWLWSENDPELDLSLNDLSFWQNVPIDIGAETTQFASETAHSGLLQHSDSDATASDRTWISNENAISQQHPKESEIDTCYGTLTKVTVSLYGDMQAIYDKLKQTNGSYGIGFAGLDITVTSDNFEVLLPNGKILGIIEPSFADRLRRTSSKFTLHLEAVFHVDNALDRIVKATTATEATILVDVNVYGAGEDAAAIGRLLSNNKIWLQKPSMSRDGMLLHNPHVLRLSGLNDGNIKAGPVSTRGPANSKRADADRTEFRKAMKEVYDGLTRNGHLNRVHKDVRVKSELMPHQEEGLDFMIQREEGNIPRRFRLWKEEQIGNNLQYRHVVTDSVSHIQCEEAGGGILADDMGVGKTLSILSLIACTSEKAHDWAHDVESSDDADSKRKRSKATLVVVPQALLIDEWLNEMELHLDESFRHVLWHGSRRKRQSQQLYDVDLIFTTYNTLVEEFRNTKQANKDSILHEIDFFRVVLDEAHIIRHQTTWFNKAVSELSARSRWCLTGTPIQNRFEDIGSLFAFVRAWPFHNHAMFRRFIVHPFCGSKDERAKAVKNLVTLIDALCIRRTKLLLGLPSPDEKLIELEFSSRERKKYDLAAQEMWRRLTQQVNHGKTAHALGLFQIKLQLRILCNHGTFQRSHAWRRHIDRQEADSALALIQSAREVRCSCCHQIVPVTSARNAFRVYDATCGHVICDLCSESQAIERMEVDNLDSECQICVGSAASGDSEAHAVEAMFHPDGFSTKLNQLVQDLQDDLHNRKSIVFSSWTRTLQLVGKHLQRAGILFARIDGSVPTKERGKLLKAFSAPNGLPVLIMTTGTGAYGLNLTAARRIFILEPQWNPALEHQAISRAVRIRQTSSVQVVRYIMKNTVERDMQLQQKRKTDNAGVLDQGTTVLST